MFKTKKDKLEKEFMKEEREELEDLTGGSEENLEIEKGGQEAVEETTAEEVKGKEKNKIEKLQAEIETLKDQFLRKAAEFENYKKRNEAESASFFKYANENIISSLLPVLDDFERVMEYWNEKHNLETFKKGVELIYEKFRTILEKQGLKQINSNGQKFDVNLHDALMMTPDEKSKPDTVLETVEKGYYLKDKVIRHAKVIVSAPKDQGKKEPGDDHK